MKTDQESIRIPLQVGAELKIRNDGTIVVGNPELELTEPETADAVFSYRFDAKAGVHILRLLEPVAERKRR